ncbi:MAG: heme lyase CcmF/NrfE family subunit [Gemmatimonadaceae bacterium]|nr:heme lyase CcmF/NrfE family subunit [Gemmatimonadaceae bacterium]
MIRLGEWSLWTAVLMAALASAASFAAGARRRTDWQVVGERATYLTFAGTLLAALGLWTALFQRDFGIRLVATSSSLYLSRLYTFAALWAGPAGSMLLWTLLLTLYAAVAVRFSKRTTPVLMPWVTGTLGVISLFFLATMAIGANPFERLDWIPPDGLGLNPQLQHPGMLLHIPMLYLGLVGTSVPYAFAMSALVSGHFDADWIAAVRRWITLSWFFLTIGIVLGMWWSSVTAGWGGVWAWDAAENASLLPWLSATAFLHAIVVQERRGMLRAWNVTLVVATFLLSMLCVWILRSGVSASVRVGALSPVAGWMLVFCLAATLLSAFLVHLRIGNLRSSVELESMRSREGALLSTNAVLIAVVIATLWGTLFPLVSHAVQGEGALFGPPFFNAVNGAFGIGLLALIGIGPVLNWGNDPRAAWRRAFVWPLLAGGVAFAFVLALGVRHWFALATYPLTGVAVGTITQAFVTGVAARRRTHTEGLLVAAWRLVGSDRRRYGGYVIHVGVLALLCGLAGLTFSGEHRAVLSTGESVAAIDPFGHEWTFASQGVSSFDQPDRGVVAISLAVRRDGQSMGLLTSEQQQQFDERGEPTFEPVTRIGVLMRPTQDVTLVLTSRIDKDVAAVQIHFNPLASWVWFGGLVMALGGLLMMWPRAHQPAQVWRREDAANTPPRATVSDDEVEAAIRRARDTQKSCIDCGPRPEPDAIYCSNCGVLLVAER